MKEFWKKFLKLKETEKKNLRNGIEKMVYTKLPQTLDLEESIDLQWQKDKFQLFLEANEDNIEKSKPLVFYVNDSTGKQYTVKTKENASCYFKE